MFDKPIDTSAPILGVLSERWSGVAFNSDRNVSNDTILALAEAARWSPSCFGDQPWRFIIFNKAQDREAWQLAWECLSEKNQVWTRHTPVLILTCCDTLFSHNGKTNDWCEYDTGAASMSICIQATALGLMTHQMAGFSKEKARETFSIPERYQPLAMMALGYQLPKDGIPEEFSEKEFSPRQRRPVQDNFFLGKWAKGL